MLQCCHEASIFKYDEGHDRHSCENVQIFLNVYDQGVKLYRYSTHSNAAVIQESLNMFTAVSVSVRP